MNFSETDIVYDMQDPIISYLEQKGEKGSSFHELQVSFYFIVSIVNALLLE